MIPLIFPSYMGEHYQLLARGHTGYSGGDLVTNTDAAHLFGMITRELTITLEQWRSVLTRLGIPVPHNFYHSYDIYQELVKLCQRGDLRLVKIPRLERLPAIATGTGWGYCFGRGPQPYPSTSYSSISISSIDEAQTFLNSINSSEKALRLCTHRNPALAALLDREENITRRFIEGLVNKDILAYKVPVEAAAPPVKPAEYLPATTVDRPVPLAPESSNCSASSNAKNSEKVDSAPIEMAVRSDNSHSKLVYEKPTAEEIALAKSEGSSSLHIQAREKVSRYFLQSNGFSEVQIATAVGDEATGIDGGVDLTKPVEIMNFPPPESMTQYVNSHGFPGNWFDPLGNQTPDALGLNGYGRKLTSFKVPTGQGLLSHSKPIVDNWTNPLNPVSTQGGGKQLFINDTTKKSIISLNKLGM